MESAAQEEAPAAGAGGRTAAHRTAPCEPELGPRPYARLMTAVGTIGAAAAGVATVLGLSGVPALPFPVDVPIPPGTTDLPNSLPSTLPTGFPTLAPEAPPGNSLPTSVPSFPPTFPTVPDLPRTGGAS
ncbi:hypothetical protein [Streptomyces nitrosporeus]|uniref:hypothetical protein n=1 Tax=Streptomyces nitrosporeus TaxID=28894 RepID=UPI003322ED42